MKKQITVLLADMSPDFLALVRGGLEKTEDISVLGASGDGEELLALIDRLRPDALVMDLMLRHIDGIGVLRELRRRAERPRVLVVTAFHSDALAGELSGLGVRYLLLKPCRLSTLAERLRDCAGREESGPARPDPYGREIEAALRAAQVLPRLNGYTYLREALRAVLEDGRCLAGVTKILYPDLARRFHTAPACIERSMRTALETAWERGDAAERRDYFGPVWDGVARRPSNVEFLSVAAAAIRAKCAEREGFAG